METGEIPDIHELVRRKLEGTSYGDIRAELARAGMSAEEIRRVIRQVDEKVLDEAVSGSSPDKSRQLYLAGIVLAVGGLVFTLLYSMGYILQGVHRLIIYIPFLLGILLMVVARRIQGRPPSKKQQGTGAIRRQRPFK